jgi:chromosome segregation ATPase
MSVAGTRRTGCDSHPGPVKRAETYTTIEVQDMTRRLYTLIEKHYSMRDELQKKRQEQNVLEHKISTLEQDVQRSQESIDELQRKIADILKVNI